MSWYNIAGLQQWKVMKAGKTTGRNSGLAGINTLLLQLLHTGSLQEAQEQLPRLCQGRFVQRNHNFLPQRYILFCIPICSKKQLERTVSYQKLTLKSQSNKSKTGNRIWFVMFSFQPYSNMDTVLSHALFCFFVLKHSFKEQFTKIQKTRNNTQENISQRAIKK